MVDIVDDHLASFVSSREAAMAALSPDMGHLADYAKALLGNGKRFRARFCYWGWRAADNSHGSVDVSDGVETLSDIVPVVSLATSLEVFHAAALVHDDIMDNSDTRRGSPSAHKYFEKIHQERAYSGSEVHFGESTALLLGDLLLAWSDDLLSEALVGQQESIATATRQQFSQMRQEVTLGQYLDIHAEAAWNHTAREERLERALRVVTYKSAKYSMEAPLLIGASLAGATPEALEDLSAFGLPLGIAFQLRDDLLGVFGDSELTGKPSGDDLREGKRTALIALGEQSMPANAQSLFNELLGDRSLTGEQIEVLQSTLRATGAVEQVEDLIDQYAQESLLALGAARIAPGAKKELSRLAAAVTKRQS
jgi:geranylgeranyl diphosphate synthase type I